MTGTYLRGQRERGVEDVLIVHLGLPVPPRDGAGIGGRVIFSAGSSVVVVVRVVLSILSHERDE